MLKKYEEAKQQYNKAVEKLFKGINAADDKYVEFLAFSSRMYKMPFSDAVVLFDQNSDIQKAAELCVWNKLGRRVTRG